MTRKPLFAYSLERSRAPPKEQESGAKRLRHADAEHQRQLALKRRRAAHDGPQEAPKHPQGNRSKKKLLIPNRHITPPPW
jgi:hypothetical protein